MKKEVGKWQLKDFLLPLLALPYGFWSIYWYENGFNWLIVIFAIVLFIVIPAVVSVFWEKI